MALAFILVTGATFLLPENPPSQTLLHILFYTAIIILTVLKAFCVAWLVWKCICKRRWNTTTESSVINIDHDQGHPSLLASGSSSSSDDDDGAEIACPPELQQRYSIAFMLRHWFGFSHCPHPPQHTTSLPSPKDQSSSDHDSINQHQTLSMSLPVELQPKRGVSRFSAPLLSTDDSSTRDIDSPASPSLARPSHQQLFTDASRRSSLRMEDWGIDAADPFGDNLQLLIDLENAEEKDS